MVMFLFINFALSISKFTIKLNKKIRNRLINSTKKQILI